MNNVSVTANLYNSGKLLCALTLFADDAKEGIKKIRDTADGAYYKIVKVH